MAGHYNPHISVDCVVFGFSSEGLKVLLVERTLDLPGNIGQSYHDLKLPGSLVYNDELLDDAAQRVLCELTGLDNIFLEKFDVLDSLHRLKNQMDKEWLETTTGLTIDRVISVAYYGLVNLTINGSLHLGGKSKWVDISETRRLPFDHSEIIERALGLLRQRMRTDSIAFGLLPGKFSILQLQELFQVFFSNKLDSRNFRKKLKTLDFIIPLNEKQTSVAHKPARLYRFDKKRFLQRRKEKSQSII